jgi:hypothetical protein
MDDLPAMSGEELGSDAAQRFAARCADALDARLRLWSDRLQRDLGAARDSQQMSHALVNSRAALRPICRFTESSLILDELRSGLADALRAAITGLQEELERQAARSSYEVREATLGTLRHAPLTRALDGDCSPAPRAAERAAWDTIAPAGARRVLLEEGEKTGG